MDDLDPDVFGWMTAEIEHDILAGGLHIDPLLTDSGAAAYPGLLLEAARAGDPGRLIALLTRPGVLHAAPALLQANDADDRSQLVRTATVLATSQFERFLLRGLCRSVITAAGTSIELRTTPASRGLAPAAAASDLLRLDARFALRALRRYPTIEAALGVPPCTGLELRVRAIGDHDA